MQLNYDSETQLQQVPLGQHRDVSDSNSENGKHCAQQDVFM